MSTDICVKPECQYTIREIQNINRALNELARHERNMLAYYNGFGTEDQATRSKDILSGIENGIYALNMMIGTENIKL